MCPRDPHHQHQCPQHDKPRHDVYLLVVLAAPTGIPVGRNSVRHHMCTAYRFPAFPRRMRGSAHATGVSDGQRQARPIRQ
ncbi:hypothetical protein G6F32_017130 [Rhizopus arrhizus]|nr:hypothetical protein G6F32_017130 [Rhizopus arrhizus]